MSTKMTLFEALNALKGLPKNAPETEIEAAKLDVRDARQRATPEELEKAKAEYTEYNDLLNGIFFNPIITNALNAMRSRTKSNPPPPQKKSRTAAAEAAEQDRTDLTEKKAAYTFVEIRFN